MVSSKAVIVWFMEHLQKIMFSTGMRAGIGMQEVRRLQHPGDLDVCGVTDLFSIVPALYPTLALFLILFASFTISTATGFGAAVMAIPICSLFIDVKLVVPLLALSSVLTCAWMTTREHEAVDWPELRRMLAWGALGFPLGNLGFHYLPISTLKFLLGIFITAVAVHGLWRLYQRRPRTPWKSSAGRAFLILGGIIQGALASGGPLIVTYAHHVMPEKRRFRATLFVFWIVFNTAFLASYFASAEGNPVVLLLGLLAIPALAAGTWLGQKLHLAASDLFFQILVSGILLVSGISLLMR